MCTGAGKSKIAVDEAIELVAGKKDANIILAVPTKKLKDKNWPEEFKKWKGTRIFNKNVKKYCYVSLNKVAGETVDLLIMDEGHNITPSNSEFFANNRVLRCLMLSATPPNPKGGDTEKEKVAILNRLGLETIFTYTLDQGVREGVVADYEINVVECYLDDTDKYLQAGTQTKPFMQTEYAAYKYICSIIKKMMYSKNGGLKFKVLERMHLIKGLRSKTNMAKIMINHVLPPDGRYIIFCGSIKQANELMGADVYHSEVSDAAFQAFCNEKIAKLGVVDAVNEGHSVPNVDGALIVQLSSQKRALIQRIGRAVRIRPGHKAKIWILVTRETVDENWFKQAIEDFDPTKIKYHHYKNIMNEVLIEI